MSEEKQYRCHAEDYVRNSSSQQDRIKELVSKLDLQGYEAVLDIGCGDGRITAEIAEHLPQGEVLGVDSSEDMLDLAREEFPWAEHPNLSFQQRDAGELACEAEFDLVFSNGALHQVKDHRSVLTGISRALKLGGRIFLQMAGKGNASPMLTILDEIIITEKWQQYFTEFTFPYSFHEPELYKKWLREAGLHPVRVELIAQNISYSDRAGLEDWLGTRWQPYTNSVPAEHRQIFLTEIVDRYLAEYPMDNKGHIHVSKICLEVEACPGESRGMCFISPSGPAEAL